MKKNRFYNSLYWKVGLTFLLILILLSAVYIYISAFTAEMYFQEANQHLNADIAPHIAAENQCFIDGKANENRLKDVFHDVMVINPSIEVYLLDDKGKILTYFAPHKTLELEYIPLEHVKEFIETNGEEFVLGVDPKNPEAEKVFSAAPVYEDGKLMGYIYVILASEEYESNLQFLFGSYILRLGLRSMSITFAAAVIITLIALGFIMGNIKRILAVVRDFKNGNLKARIKKKRKDELGEFADSFNEMADTIVQNMEDLKTMDNLRRELVANVSHDLRTPLATIQGYLETILIKAETLSEEEKNKYLNTIFKSTERLRKLVDELFELSKLEARERKPKKEAFSIAELVQDVHQKYLILAEAKNINLKTKFSYSMPLVYADIGMMERVIQNLLENGLKFTAEGGVIEIILEQKDDHIIVNVKDSGEGIKESELPYIFDRYNKSSRSVKNDNEGLGLGLAIVKKILEVHNIEISVKSKKGEGTNFSFSIPVYKSSEIFEVAREKSIS
ncbi:MAG: sensor histidine kinase [Ignavibacteriales bacterium]|nr:MAG: sensor histidine kinase [Ignavibacteriales bacterium]